MQAANAGGAGDRSGRLDETPVPRLLLELAAECYTGTLHIARGREKVRVAWLRGMPVACDTEPPGPGLTELLVERGLISAKNADRARAARASKNLAEEGALLALSLVAPRDLVLARREVLARRLVGLGRLASGEFRTDATLAPAAASEPLRVDPLPVVQNLVAAHWRPDRLLADLEAKLRLHPLPSAVFARLLPRLERSPAVDALGASVDGTRTAWSLVASTGDVARIAALWVLDGCGAFLWSETPAGLAPADEPAAPAVPTADAPEIEIEVRAAAGPAKDAAPGTARNAKAAAAGDARAADLRAEIVEKRSHLAELSHYALLGIEPTAKPADLKRAYLKAAKRFHPDALARVGLEDLKRDANEIFAAIARANDVLSDPQRRRDYDAALASGDVEIDVDRVAQAESLYRKAEMMMRAGQFAGASELVQAAVNLWPEDAAYQGALGWCLFKKIPPDESAARIHLERSIALDDKNAAMHLRLGIVLEALGDAASAAQAAARGKHLDPKARP